VAAAKPIRSAAKRAPAKPAPPAAQAGELGPALTELGLAFRHVFRAVSRLRGRDTHLAGEELSHAQVELLIELDERGALAAGELATAARLTPATVTQMLDHLAESGHVERVRSDTDRRVVVSRLTDQGRAKIQAKRAVWAGRWQAALGDVSDRDLRAAARVLRRLGEMFDAPPTEGAGEPSEAHLQSDSQTARQPA
jgi:MarR family transcriptional regulator, organic hydroperoxide resistance regulator